MEGGVTMKTADFLFGRERILVVDGQKIKVHQLPGSTEIFVDEKGGLILPRWRGAEEGETPHQRAQKKWRSKELGYVIYPQGLSSALRSRQLALSQAQQISLPTYKKALQIFEAEVRGTIIKQKTMDPQEISPALRKQLRQFGFVFQRAQKPGVKEAMVKILFLYHDEASGLNVGAMLARTVAITDRLRERLLGFYSWVRKYSAQEKVLLMIEIAVNEIIFQVASQMEQMGHNPAIIQGRVDRKTQKLIADQLTTISMRLEPLKAIQPFSSWMTFVMKDFDEMLSAIETQDFILVRALIERVIFSFNLKSIQGSLDRLLLRVGQDAIIKRLDWNNYEAWVVDLGGRLRDLSVKERRVGLREKVCRSAALALFAASLEANEERRLTPFEAAVKRAYVLL